jgi:hypothetical protein
MRHHPPRPISKPEPRRIPPPAREQANPQPICSVPVEGTHPEPLAPANENANRNGRKRPDAKAATTATCVVAISPPSHWRTRAFHIRVHGRWVKDRKGQRGRGNSSSRKSTSTSIFSAAGWALLLTAAIASLGTQAAGAITSVTPILSTTMTWAFHLVSNMATGASHLCTTDILSAAATWLFQLAHSLATTGALVPIVEAYNALPQHSTWCLLVFLQLATYAAAATTSRMDNRVEVPP